MVGQVVGHPGRAVAEELVRESVRSVPTTPVVPVPGPAVQSSPEPAPAPVSQPQIALLCFRGAGVILLSSAPVARPHQRLARDIVQAAQRIRQQPDIAVDTVDYSYPMIPVKPAMPNPSGLPDAARERTTGSPERALRAFVSAQLSRPVEGKQASIGIPGLVLLTHDLQSWFGSWLEEPHLYIDGLALLAGDGARKRHLWQQLRALR